MINIDKSVKVLIDSINAILPRDITHAMDSEQIDNKVLSYIFVSEMLFMLSSISVCSFIYTHTICFVAFLVLYHEWFMRK